MINKSLCFVLVLRYILPIQVHGQSREVDDFTLAHDAEVRLKRNLLQDYSIDVLPPHNFTSPVVTFVNVIILLIKDLDGASQTLTTECWLQLTWKDTRLAWEREKYAGIRNIRLASNKIWKPDVHLYNSAKMSEMDKAAAEVPTTLHSDGEVWWIYPVTFYTICTMNLLYYPFDKHTCSMTLGSWTHAGDNLDIALSTHFQGPTMDLSLAHNQAGEWEIVSSSRVKHAYYYACCNESYPDVEFSLTLQRRSPFYKAAIGCPLVAATILLLVSFWTSPLVYQRITLLVVSLFTALALMMHLTSKLPAVGDDKPLIMTFFGVLLMLSTIATVVSVVFRTVLTSKKTSTPGWIEKIVQNRFVVCLTTNMKNANDRNGGTFLSSTAIDNHIGWLAFFQLIDRAFFVVSLIIITAVISSSG